MNKELFTLKWLLGSDAHLFKYLDEASREEIKKIPLMERAPPTPFEMQGMDPLQKEFYVKMHPHLPSPYFLTKDPLNRLVSLSKEQLDQICRFLGLYDLYQEIKHVVKTNIFQSLKIALSQKELQFLEICRHESNPVHLPAMHIGAWDLKKESLDKALYERGKTRLRGALSSSYGTLFPLIPANFSPPEQKPSKEIIDTLLKQVETVLSRAL